MIPIPLNAKTNLLQDALNEALPPELETNQEQNIQDNIQVPSYSFGQILVDPSTSLIANPERLQREQRKKERQQARMAKDLEKRKRKEDRLSKKI